MIAAIVVVVGAAAAYVTTSQRLDATVDESLLTAAARLPGVHDPTSPAPQSPDGQSPDNASPDFARPEGCPRERRRRARRGRAAIDADRHRHDVCRGWTEHPGRRRPIARWRRRGGTTRLRTVTIGGDDYRVVTIASSSGAYQLARGLGENESVLDSLRLRLVLVGPRRRARRDGPRAGCSRVGSCNRSTVCAWPPSTSPTPRTSRAPVPVDGPAEIGSLGRSFTTMVRALARSRRAQQELVRDASHELRTPLTSLRTNSELLGRADELAPEEYAAVVAGIQHETKELADLVAELVDLATDAPVEVVDQPVHLGAVARAVGVTAQRRTGRTVDVAVIDADVDGDPSDRRTMTSCTRTRS